MLDVAGYLGRLGMYGPDPPSPDGLVELHRAQVERIPYSTIDIHLGRPCSLDPADAIDRIVRTGRAGYCFNLNGAFAALLGCLGYDVWAHCGWVWRHPGDVALEPHPNHLALTVHGLPSPDSPDGVWFADAGLGDALHEPLALVPGPQPQGPFTYQLEVESGLPGWRFRHDPAGTFVGMDFESGPAAAGAFDASHQWRSTAPESNFRKNVIVQRRDATGADKLVNCSVSRVEGARTVTWEITSSTEWFAAIADVFGLPLDDLDGDDRALLWARAQAGQAEWRRSQDAAG